MLKAIARIIVTNAKDKFLVEIIKLLSGDSALWWNLQNGK